MTDKLRDRLLNYAPEPPDGLWEHIAQSVETEPLAAVAERLFAFEAEPPIQTWSKIGDALDIQKTTKVINLLDRAHRKPLMSAAAVLLLIGGLAYAFYLSGVRATNNRATPVYHEQSIIPDVLPKPTGDASRQKAEPKAGVHFLGGTSKKINQIRRLLLHAIPYQRPESGPQEVTVASSSAELHLVPIDEQKEERFMVYTDSDGRCLLVPKKLFDLLHCATEDPECKNRLRKLQQKLVESSVNADFSGVIEILNQLQENR